MPAPAVDDDSRQHAPAQMRDRTALGILLLTLGYDLLVRIGLAISEQTGVTTDIAASTARSTTILVLAVVVLVVGRTRRRKLVAGGLLLAVAALRLASALTSAEADVTAAERMTPLVGLSWWAMLVGVVAAWGIARCSGRRWILALLVVPVVYLVVSLPHTTWWFAPSAATDDLLDTILGKVAYAVSSWLQFAAPVLAGVLACGALQPRDEARS